MKFKDLTEIHFYEMNDTDKHIAWFIQNNKKLCSTITIEELANRCNVSRTTLLRFSKKIGYTGFSELKVHLKMECDERPITNQKSMDQLCDIYKSCIEEIEKNSFENVCKEVFQAKKIYVYASGYLQENVARELIRLFMGAGVCITQVPPLYREYHLMAEMMNEGDLCFIVSYSGESNHTKDFAKSLKLKKCKMISITQLKNNSLSRLCDEAIYVSTNKMDISHIVGHETTAMFFLLVEFLELRYLLYLETKDQEKM